MFDDTYNPLLTDQYTLTMAQSFWLHNQGEEDATFDLFVRKLPENRHYLVAAGLEQVVDYLEHFVFLDEELDFLDSLGIYQQDFLDYLAELTFTGELRAVAEGTILPAQAPILSVTAPRIEASIIEPALLAIINHQTMIASKASRIVDAAQGRDVFDFSMRRLHGLGPAVSVARAAYIAGAAGTATVAAGQEIGIPTSGTMAHHYVQSFGPDNEVDAFVQFMRDYPDNSVLLVDTYDTLQGVKNVCQASKITGIIPKAIRLDSGDLLDLSRQARIILDQCGLVDTGIFVSNDLDEYTIERLVSAQAPIDGFGVGTRLGVSSDTAYLGGVYKLVAQETEDQRPNQVMKLAKNKVTDPGQHQLWRLQDNSLLLSLLGEEIEGKPLLETIIDSGEQVKELPDLDTIKAYRQRELEALTNANRAITDGQDIALNRTTDLLTLRSQLGEEQ